MEELCMCKINWIPDEFDNISELEGEIPDQQITEDVEKLRTVNNT